MLSFVAYFETLLQLSLHFCQFTSTLWNSGKKYILPIQRFSPYWSTVISKNAWLPPVFFLDFNSPWYDLLVSNSRYLGQKYFPYRCRRPKCNKQSSGLHNCLEFSQPLECLYQAMQTQEKSFLLLKYCFYRKYCYFAVYKQFICKR